MQAQTFRLSAHEIAGGARADERDHDLGRELARLVAHDPRATILHTDPAGRQRQRRVGEHELAAVLDHCEGSTEGPNEKRAGSTVACRQHACDECGKQAQRSGKARTEAGDGGARIDQNSFSRTNDEVGGRSWGRATWLPRYETTVTWQQKKAQSRTPGHKMAMHATSRPCIRARPFGPNLAQYGSACTTYSNQLTPRRRSGPGQETARSVRTDRIGGRREQQANQ